MPKAITVDPTQIPPADRARVQAAIHGKFGGQLGTTMPGDVTATHIVELLEDEIKGWVLKWERSQNKITFDAGHTAPAVET